MKKFDYIFFEEGGMLLVGYCMDKKKALTLMRKEATRVCGSGCEVLDEEVSPVYELTTVTSDDGSRYTWKKNPASEDFNRPVAWVQEV